MATGETRTVTAKTDTTPPDFERGVLNAVTKAAIDPASIDFLAHGTTVVINALTERKGVRVGLITTDGFRDSLEIARGNRPDFFNLQYRKPPPFVPRYLRREVVGRIDYLGEETIPLNLDSLQPIIASFKEEAVEAIAVCFLHAYANSSHELQTVERIRALWPSVAVVASHQITREWREYERCNTTVMSAYVQPVTQRYLKRLDDGLRSSGFSGSPYIMQSNCGVDSLEAAARVPITMVESGPASGFLGAAELGKRIGEPNILALDIGGTTAKCALIEGGNVRVMTDYWIERDRKSSGYPIMVPVVDLVEIGNGGGSIAWVDEFSKLHVGPQSAGALPGPAAYGKGGTQATTTDANLWLGRINPEYFCGGEIEADMAAARAAIEAVGKRLNVSADEAARGIVRIANNNMVNALKLVSLNRGFDPRDFTMLAFGGGGAMHAAALAIELGIRKIIIPQEAAVFSAWGMMLSDLRRDYFITRLLPLTQGSAQAMESAFSEAEDIALEQFTDEGVDTAAIEFRRYAKLRYQNQEHTTEVSIHGRVTEASLSAIAKDFREAYEREYTYQLDSPVELVGIHLVASAQVGKPDLPEAPQGGSNSADAIKGRRKVDYALEGILEAVIYDRAGLQPGMQIEGPAIVESSGTTIVVHPASRASIDGFGNVIIEMDEHD